MSKFKKMKLSEARAKFEQIDELSHGTLRRYRMKAKSVGDNEKGDINYRAKGRELAGRKTHGGQYGIEKAKVMAKEEAEQIDELSKGKIASYIHKAEDSADDLERKAIKGDDKSWRKMHKRLDSTLKAKHKWIHAKEEAEQIDELSKATLGSYIKKAAPSAIQHGIEHGKKKAEQDEVDRITNRHMSFGDKDKIHKALKTTHADVDKPREKALRRNQGIIRATNRLTKEEAGAVDGCECMTDTSSGGADQIATSKTGEVYKKLSKQTTGPSPATGTGTHVVAGKEGEAYNATGITKRVPAVESAVLDVMTKTFEKRKMFEDASNIAIISPEQRQDWLEVSKGNMEVVDYFNKYKV